MRVAWTRQGLASLREIAMHVAHHTDLETGDLAAARVQVAVEDLLSQFPRIGGPGRVTRTRTTIVRVGSHPYRAVYRIVGERVLIDYVRDTRRGDAM
ncbi:MAG TPA: type II toxin-antitoxin system RelE/ParE family toxin [Chloroflexota bacterium]|nr:type II toxin-antitoxin system RelE/ParE family toxin [Chloroflexota bacterium]